MKRRRIEFRGLVIDASRQIESVRPIAEKSDIDLDSLDDVEVLFVASKMKNMTIPEFLGLDRN